MRKFVPNNSKIISNLVAKICKSMYKLICLILLFPGSTYIRNLLEQWNVRHAVRTVVGVGAFTFALYRLAKGKH